MAKRFSDTEVWADAWFMALAPKLKMAWYYVCAKCDGAGVWNTNFPLMSFCVGDRITQEEFLAAMGPRIVVLPNGRLWVPKFIPFQYSTLKIRNHAHRGIMRKIIAETEGLPLDADTRSLIEGFRKSLENSNDCQMTVNRQSDEGQLTPQEKEEEKVKEKEKEKGSKKARTDKFDFDAIYKKYPRKEGKTAGMAKCRRDITSPAEYAKLELALDRFNRHHKAKGTEKQYLPMFSTFMSSWEDCLDDDYGTVALSTAPNPAEVARREAERARRDAEVDATAVDCPEEFRGILSKFKIPGVA